MGSVTIEMNDDIPDGKCVMFNADGDLCYCGTIWQMPPVFGNEKLVINSKELEDLQEFLKRRTN